MYAKRNLVIDKEIKDSFRISRLSDTRFNESGSVSVVYNRIFILPEATGVIQIDHTIGGKEIFLVSKGQVFSFTSDTRLDGFEIMFGDCFWERTPASASNCKAVLFNNTALNQII